MDSYRDQLNRIFGEKRISVETPLSSRLPVPDIKMMYYGDTIISNIDEVCGDLRRDVDHFAKFLKQRAGCGANHSQSKMILYKYIPYDELRLMYKEYIKKYVECKECGKLDTKLESTTERITCEVCGANYTV